MEIDHKAKMNELVNETMSKFNLEDIPANRLQILKEIQTAMRNKRLILLEEVDICMNFERALHEEVSKLES